VNVTLAAPDGGVLPPGVAARTKFNIYEPIKQNNVYFTNCKFITDVWITRKFISQIINHFVVTIVFDGRFVPW